MATLSIRSCLTAFALAATLLLPPSASAQDPVYTSMVQLLAHPKKYHGKRVDVFGYLHVKFEGNAIYLSKTDADYINPKHAFWTQYRQGVTLRASNRKKGASLSEFDCKVCVDPRSVRQYGLRAHGSLRRRDSRHFAGFGRHTLL